MKKLLFLILPIFLTSCFGVKQIGKLNMISERNVELESTNYELIKTYGGSSSKKEIKREYKKVKAKTIEQAVNHTVKNTPGGEFLTNVQIYSVNATYYIVIGDVWGVKDRQRDHKGFQKGDRVQYRRAMQVRTGVIADLKDANEATIKEDDSERYYTISYDKLIKID